MGDSKNFWPYIARARILKKKVRRGFGNMFRHQMDTFAILVDYGYEDPVLLKAALIHDLLEDGPRFEDITAEDIVHIDADGQEVASIVLEVTQREQDGIEEPKKDFLLRIMQTGSEKARILKLADRIANVSTLIGTNNRKFVTRYLKETKDYILPFAGEINPKMYRELKEIIRKNIEIEANSSDQVSE
jgi:(p)ppGpp synthase/HD superfamily hydrolase